MKDEELAPPSEPEAETANPASAPPWNSRLWDVTVRATSGQTLRFRLWAASETVAQSFAREKAWARWRQNGIVPAAVGVVRVQVVT